MKRVPYHNFTHAFNIVQMTYIILSQTKLRTIIEDIDVLSAMVGALGHDIGHPGLNNMYF
jgi:HD superfamily phosphodiesterase